ncbi:MAG: prepilin-type N-terminal cleavage/methylation domain-containing protein [Candidatus Aenigmarchaeota archaeon]|nr:prepilin-type N-terminal cleavage/methylation domain-containing protein [Candidatus Aenigmarchaeota archaeon]
MKIRSDEKGFTLIELIIVIAIIGTLAAIAIPQFAYYRVRAFDTDAMSALHTAVLAQEAYYTDYQTYASTGSCQEINDISSDITIVITHSIDQYHMFAKHDNSLHWFEVHGPGGTIEATP